MKILVTGAKGFVGKNLVQTLNNIREKKDKSFGIEDDIVIYEYDIDSRYDLLLSYCSDCDFVFNFAGVNRPENEKEFIDGNYGFAVTLINALKKNKNLCPIMLSSSIKAKLDNSYGKSRIKHN